MDSNRIKKLAEGARTSLMTEVSASLDRVLQPESDERIASPSQVAEIERFVKEHGRDHVVEQVAYTWFNRLCALRYMDVKGYTSTPCVSPRSGESMPAILADARRGIFDETLVTGRTARTRAKGLLDGSIASNNPLGEAFVTLLLSACDTFAKSMGYLFGGSLGTKAALTLLAPSDLLSDGSVLQRICDGMDEDDCEDVEVLGWLYQYYIAERKNEVFAAFKKNKKAGADEIKPATQLFTPNWIVRYMVENSLGRLWMLNFPDSKIRERMDYYIEPEDLEKDFIKIYSPEEITFCDPACGSGHILVYAFDLLFEMYLEEGYRAADIPSLILGKNLSGFEIDDRAAEIAAFALEMKARERDTDFFAKDIDARITVLEPVRFDADELSSVGLLVGQHDLLEAFDHLDEVGSLYHPEPSDKLLVEDAIASLKDKGGMFAEATLEKLEKMEKTIGTLSQRFDVVVANPPYMGSGNMNAWLAGWLKDLYPDEKSDLCTCFVERGFSLAKQNGYTSMVTMQSWMFLGSYERMRGKLLRNRTIVSMNHLGARAFDAIGGEVVATAATSFLNAKAEVTGSYVRLVDIVGCDPKRVAYLEAIHNPECGWFYRCDADSFKDIPGSPIAYWIGNQVRKSYETGQTFADVAHPKVGMQTSNNDKYLRIWWEVKYDEFNGSSAQHIWIKYLKGGSYRKWYGNLTYLLHYKNDSNYILEQRNARVLDLDYLNKRKCTWTDLTSGTASFRFAPQDTFYDISGHCFFPSAENQMYLLGYANSSFVAMMKKVFNSSFHFQVGDLAKIVVPEINSSGKENVSKITKQCVSISEIDWDSFETSWDFTRHPLLTKEPRERVSIADAFSAWSAECQSRFDTLKSNEEELNRIFAEIYDLEGEVPIEVPDDKVSVRLADKGRDIRSLISYAVGCMFGRYSLDEDGLILANQGDTLKDYLVRISNPTFMPDEDNILPVLDEEWFEDDIVGRFKEWLKAAYSPETYAENLAFIEDALGMDIRTYFTKKTGGFYDDHCQTYSVTGSGKRPIYWMFSSPDNSFNALIYMHRYDEGTVGKILTDYVREMRHRLDAQIAVLMASQSAKDQSQAYKYQAMADELDTWEREVLYPLAQSHVHIDLDDGVKINYNKFPHALRRVSGLSKW